MITYEHQMKEAYFWRRANRTNPVTNKAPIVLRIEIQGFERAEFATGVHATEKEWNTDTQRLQITRGLAKEEHELIRLANKKIVGWQVALEQAYAFFKGQGASPSPAELRELLRGNRSTRDEKRKLLVLAERFMQDLSRPEKRRQPNTLRSMREALSKLIAYCSYIKKPHVLASDINRAWCRDYERWCMAQGWNGSTVQWRVNVLRRVVGFAADEGVIETSLIDRYVFLSESEPSPKRHVTREELALLEATRFINSTMQRVADIFIFCCYTGLAPVDYDRFAATPAEFLAYEEGVLGIRMVRQKMLRKQKAFWVPLFPKAAELFFTAYCRELPRFVSSYISSRLKLIAAELGSERFHLQDLMHKDARSTFSQHMRDKFGGEVAAGMAGHGQEVMNSNYSSTSPKRIVEQIKILGGLLTDN